MDHPLVYIIILNWNGHEDTVECLSSLFKIDYPNYRIIVVDNGSVDDSLTMLEKFTGRMTLLKSEVNLGYTGGNNLGMRHALANGAEYVWLLNNDAVVPPQALTKLVTGAVDGQIDVASPVIYYADWPSRVWFCCANFDVPTCTYRATTDIATARTWQRDERDHIAVAGTAMLIRRSVIETIGMLDDRFFAYWEDIDYCIRGAKAKFRIGVIFDAAVYHRKAHDGPTVRVKPYICYFLARNELLMWRKYVSGIRRLKVILWHLKRMFWWIQRSAAHPAEKQACLAGIWDGWNNVTGPFDPTRHMPEPFRTLIGSSFTQFIVAATRRPWHMLKYVIRKE